jgi:hypothetical protein
MPSAGILLLEWRLPGKKKAGGFSGYSDTTSAMTLCKYECHERMITCGELVRTFGRKQS